jgi:diguanylate cyclase (GGDEF)-like protein
MLLESAGYSEVVTADSASQALRYLGVDRPHGSHPQVDAVLMDIMMPGLDGIQACRRIKAAQWLRDIPVIMVTGRDEKRELARAFEAGATDYITKPIHVVELLARLRGALSLKREMDWHKQREQELLQMTQKLQAANQKLQALSTLDSLTEIPNRRAFESFLFRAWRQGMRNTTPISLIMIDVDYFKEFNDANGHQEGDACLKTIARVLSRALQRPIDLVARYGGEEFAAVLPETEVRGAAVVAENMRRSVARQAIHHAHSLAGNCVTISAGVAATVPTQTCSVTDLIASADRALYDAKRHGRDQVWIADFTDARSAPSTLEPRHAASSQPHQLDTISASS